jgi:hypothetical protein
MAYSPNTADIINLILQGSSNVESVIRANSLDQLTAPAANLSMNTHRLTNLAQGIVSTDAPDLAQLVGTSMPYVVSGCVWTADSPGSTRNCSMTSGSVMIGGILLTVASVSGRTFTASNDTYVDFADNGDGTATITYTAVPNMQTSPALASSGTALNTIRNAVISVGASSVAANGIGQGGMFTGVANPVPVNAGTQGSTTVAAGSNGHAITATPLAVAAITNFPSGGGYALWTAASTSEQALLQYTSTSAGNLNGITVLAGRAAATVATGDSVVGAWPVLIADTIGNRLNPIQPYGNIRSACFELGVLSTTGTTNGTFVLGPTNQPTQILYCSFVVPAGPPRQLRVIAQFPNVRSSAAVGTITAINVGQAVSGGGLTSWANASPQVKVQSDGDAVNITGYSTSLFTAGTYGVSLSLNPGAAGTMSLGESLTQSTIVVEFV